MTNIHWTRLWHRSRVIWPALAVMRSPIANDHSPGLTRNEINDNNLQVSTDLQNFDMAKAQPNVSEGIIYWEKQTADYNGVLG